MKILVIGSGAREHAICWKLKQSVLASQIYCAPGNPGIAEVVNVVNIAASAVDELLAFALENKIDLTIVGPEQPLSLGVVDLFLSKGLKIFGPTKAAAKLESSKSFAKEVMLAAKIPTAKHTNLYSKEEAQSFLQKHGPA